MNRRFTISKGEQSISRKRESKKKTKKEIEKDEPAKKTEKGKEKQKKTSVEKTPIEKLSKREVEKETDKSYKIDVKRRKIVTEEKLKYEDTQRNIRLYKQLERKKETEILKTSTEQEKKERGNESERKIEKVSIAVKTIENANVSFKQTESICEQCSDDLIENYKDEKNEGEARTKRNNFIDNSRWNTTYELKREVIVVEESKLESQKKEEFSSVNECKQKTNRKRNGKDNSNRKNYSNNSRTININTNDSTNRNAHFSDLGRKHENEIRFFNSGVGSNETHKSNVDNTEAHKPNDSNSNDVNGNTDSIKSVEYTNYSTHQKDEEINYSEVDISVLRDEIKKKILKKLETALELNKSCGTENPYYVKFVTNKKFRKYIVRASTFLVMVTKHINLPPSVAFDALFYMHKYFQKKWKKKKKPIKYCIIGACIFLSWKLREDYDDIPSSKKLQDIPKYIFKVLSYFYIKQKFKKKVQQIQKEVETNFEYIDEMNPLLKQCLSQQNEDYYGSKRGEDVGKEEREIEKIRIREKRGDNRDEEEKK